jgi:hypothetical protein
VRIFSFGLFPGLQPRLHFTIVEEFGSRHGYRVMTDEKMRKSLDPKEIFLLERYSSAEYFRELCNSWKLMLDGVESALDRFMRNIPLNYRNRPLPQQPDAVWGEQVLPNFRATYQYLCDGLILLENGDVRGLNYCSGPINDFRGQKDYWSGWMELHELEAYNNRILIAAMMAQNISNTENAHWNPEDLSNNYDEKTFGLKDLPTPLPNYKINTSITCESGSTVAQPGIYLPNIENSCAQFLSGKYGVAPPAIVVTGTEALLHPTTGVQYGVEDIYDEADCVWVLVERDIGASAIPSLTNAPVRVIAGGVCPQSGYYFSPAKINSRRWFDKNTVMPDSESDYGSTIWQWDTNQHGLS